MDYVYYGFILIAIAFVNGFAYCYQSSSESATLESFRVLWPRTAQVIRDGGRQRIPVSLVVRGDLVELEAGKRAPADIRLVVADNLKVDNSAITGESEEQKRSAKCTSKNLLKSENVVFFGSDCVQGYGQGIVISTGAQTVIGRIARLMDKLDKTVVTPLGKEIERFECILLYSLCILTCIYLLLQLITSNYVDFWDILIMIITYTVGNLPDGLLSTTGVLLVLLAKRLAKNGLLVNKLMAMDTLGLTSVLCIGKTGILTSDKVRVSRLWMDGTIFKAEKTSDKGTAPFETSNAWELFSRCALLCNSADYELQGSKRKYYGEPKDCAMLKFMEITIGNASEIRKLKPRIFQIPFSETSGYSLTIHEISYTDHAESSHIMFIKGTPEALWERSTTIWMNGREREIDDAITFTFQDALENLGKHGESILGLCDYVLPKMNFATRASICKGSIQLPVEGLRFLGLMSFNDVLQPMVVETISKCRSAGIKIVMMTGTHPTTAKAMARRSGIITGPEPVKCINHIAQVSSFEMILAEECKAVVVNGNAFVEMKPGELENLLDSYSELVFARVTSHQKFAIVEALQSRGHKVAVTGQNFGDAISVKKADIGIAAGKCRSDIIADTADIALLGDSFQAIAEGIECGRLFYDNVKKILVFSLTSHLPESAPYFLNAWLKFPMPLLSKSFLLLNIGIDVITGISFGFEKEEGNIMLRNPKPRHKDRLLNWKLLDRTYFQIGVCQLFAAYLANLMVMAEDGFMPTIVYGLQDKWDSKAINDLQDSFHQEWTYTARKQVENLGQTAFYITIVVMQLINAFMCRTLRYSVLHVGFFSNYYLNCSLIFSLLLALALVYLPGLNTFLNIYPLRWSIWLVGIPFGVALLIFDETRRYFLRTLPPGSFVERESYY